MKNRSSLAIFTTILSVLVCFGLCPQVQAQESPTVKAADSLALPLTDLGGGNTADGAHALGHLTTGGFNSAFGWYSLGFLTDAFFNTAVGAGALDLNDGTSNTAVGAAALLLNTTGTENTAVGADALVFNSVASDNNAVGAFALENNDSDGAGLASFNNAHGRGALQANVDGEENEALGDLALTANTTGSMNTAVGDDALDGNTTGTGNVAVGKEAGNSIDTGNDNVAIGHNAGIGIVTASNSIAIGVQATGPFADLSNTCFIGSIDGEPTSDAGSTVAVLIDSNNVLGTSPSSRRYKHDIKPMDKASEAILALKPVTFKYNSDRKGTPCFGLIAEDVAQVDPDLVVRDKNGELKTVRYEQINAMLLNEFLKEHKKVQDLEVTVAQQQQGMEVLTAQLKEQAAQIQKVSAQVEMSKPAPQVVANKP